MWLTEFIIATGRRDRANLRGIGNQAFPVQSFQIKYYAFPQKAYGIQLERNADLDLFWDLRNEMVHHLPRKAMLDHFRALRDKGLLSGYGGLQAFASFELFHWCWKTVDKALTTFQEALQTSPKFRESFSRSNVQSTQPYEVYKQLGSWQRLNRSDG